MSYPRIKQFNFDIEKTYTVPSHLVGRLERIAYDIYGEYRYYKPLALANKVKLSHGFRVGIRRVEDALRTELKAEGLNESQVEEIFNEKMNIKRDNDLDWLNYFDVSYGYISEVRAGAVLLVPTFESATQFLNKYEFINTTNK